VVTGGRPVYEKVPKEWLVAGCVIGGALAGIFLLGRLKGTPTTNSPESDDAWERWKKEREEKEREAVEQPVTEKKGIEAGS
jgi:Na+/glutamate symporter